MKRLLTMIAGVLVGLALFAASGVGMWIVCDYWGGLRHGFTGWLGFMALLCTVAGVATIGASVGFWIAAGGTKGKVTE